MDYFFRDFSFKKFHKYHKHLSIHSENYYIAWKVYVLWIFAKKSSKLILKEMEENSNLVWSSLFWVWKSISSFWQLNTNYLNQFKLVL